MAYVCNTLITSSNLVVASSKNHRNVVLFLCAGVRKEISSFAARTPRAGREKSLRCPIAHGRLAEG